MNDNKAEEISRKLVDEFTNPDFAKWYLKVAYHVAENKIWNAVESSRKARNPAQLFSYLMKKELLRNM